MELSQLAKRYSDFYTPAFSVRLSGQDLVRELLAPVSQLEVDLMLGAASRFSFTIPNCYDQEKGIFRTSQSKNLLNKLEFGSKVELYMGYGDSKSLPIVLKGVVTEITTDFPEGGVPELTIAGYDYGFSMTIGKNKRTWSKKRDSYAATEIAQFHNLGAKIESTIDEQIQIEQNQESDWEFLKKLAERNHFELYVDEQATLHFARPDKKQSAIVKLEYGKALLSFRPEANLAGQISRVEVYGWDLRQNKKIVGVANAGQEFGLRGDSPGQFLRSFGPGPKKQPTLRIRQPVRSQAEAKKLAQNILNERAEKFLTGEGECIGLPEIRPDRNVKLDRLGGSFSKTYYIHQATHKIDSNGYRTRFKVKETGL
ncbi:Phage late control D protein [Gimesia fumaroli]|uniref:Phage late control D protein n=1 Tax=Gimesia fumaroli TaxID=2527976 RepID=A0A518I9U6_9PLAN|nr:phage late control D family protein [Gimesia fumaroli]QDV49896.1 Phage late control D protein [Gimesia fumaroli]